MNPQDFSSLMRGGATFSMATIQKQRDLEKARRAKRRQERQARRKAPRTTKSGQHGLRHVSDSSSGGTSTDSESSGGTSTDEEGSAASPVRKSGVRAAAAQDSNARRAAKTGKGRSPTNQKLPWVRSKDFVVKVKNPRFGWLVGEENIAIPEDRKSGVHSTASSPTSGGDRAPSPTLASVTGEQCVLAE